jgi:CHAT domain-containing protein
VETLSARQGGGNLSRAAALSTAMAHVRTGIRADGSKVAGWKADWAHPSAWAAFTNIANFD